MATNPNQRSPRQKKTLAAALAGVTTAALFLGASTTAYWSDAVKLEGGTITSGNLDIEVTQSSWYDTSNDQPDAENITGWVGDNETAKGHDITETLGTTWKASPGDTVLGLFTVDGALLGNNIAATLDLRNSETGQPITDESFTNAGFTVEYAIANKNGNLLNPDTAKELTEGQDPWVGVMSQLSFMSTQANQTVYPTFNTEVGQEDYKIAIKVTFDAENRDYVQSAKELKAITAVLTQVKEPVALKPEDITLHRTFSITQSEHDTGEDVIDPGETVNVSYQMNNNSKIAVTGVSVSDPVVEDMGATISPQLVKRLAPGTTTTFKASFEPTLTEMSTFKIDEEPVVQATVPTTGETATVAVETTPVTAVVPEPTATFETSVKVLTDKNRVGIIEPGDVLQYTYIVKNTGLVDMSSGSLTGVLGTLSSTSPIVLKAGTTQSLTSNYTITSTDGTAGSVSLAAGFKGTPDVCNASPCSAGTWAAPVLRTSVSPELVANATISTSASATTVTSGGSVTFTHTVKNTGTDTLKNVYVRLNTGVNSATHSTLLPGQSVTLTTSTNVSASQNYTNDLHATPSSTGVNRSFGTTNNYVTVQANPLDNLRIYNTRPKSTSPYYCIATRNGAYLPKGTYVSYDTYDWKVLNQIGLNYDTKDFCTRGINGQSNRKYLSTPVGSMYY